MTDINPEQVEVDNEAELKDQVSKVLMEEESQSPPKCVENGVSCSALETVETVIETAINGSNETCEEKIDTILESEESKEESKFLTEVGEENQPQDKSNTAVDSESATVDDRKGNDENQPEEIVETINETGINDTIATCEEKSSPILESEVSQEESTFMTEVVDGDGKDENQPQVNDPDCLEQLKMSIEESEREFPTDNPDESPLVKNKENEIKLSEITNDESPQKNENITENNTTETEPQLEDSILDEKIEGNKETTELHVSSLKVDEIEDIVEDNIKADVPYEKDIVEKEPNAVVENKKEPEKVPIFTLFMIAYVIFMSLILFCH